MSSKGAILAVLGAQKARSESYPQFGLGIKGGSREGPCQGAECGFRTAANARPVAADEKGNVQAACVLRRVRRERVWQTDWAGLAARGFDAGCLRRYVTGSDPAHAELRGIPAGVKKIRETRDDITLFKSVGVAVHDLAAAGEVLAGAQRLRLGVERWL